METSLLQEEGRGFWTQDDLDEVPVVNNDASEHRTETFAALGDLRLLLPQLGPAREEFEAASSVEILRRRCLREQRGQL